MSVLTASPPPPPDNTPEAVLEVPLTAYPGQIYLVPVGSSQISQSDAATGPQTKGIAILGDNVVTPQSTHSGGDAPTPEFSVFDGAEDVFNQVWGLSKLLGGPIGGAVGTAVAPMIAQGLSIDKIKADATLQRFMLANTTLLVAESKFQKEEGFFSDLSRAAASPLNPWPQGGNKDTKLPFQGIMQIIGVTPPAANKLVENVANEISRGFLLRARSPVLDAKARPVSATNLDVKETEASPNEVAFLHELAKAAKAHASTQQQRRDGHQSECSIDEGFFGSVAKLAGQIVHASIHTATVSKPERGFDKPTMLIEHHSDSSVNVAKPVDQYKGNDLFRALEKFISANRTGTTEAALQSPGDTAEEVIYQLRRFAEALILYTLLADKFLSMQMARPGAKLEAEGLFDDLLFSPGNAATIIGVGMMGASGVSAFVPPVAAVIGVPLLLGGYFTANVGQFLNEYKVTW